MVEFKKGDKVVTSGGNYWTITRIADNDKVEIEIADNVTVEVIRGTGIQSLMNSQEIKNKFCWNKVLYFSKLRIFYFASIFIFIIIALSNFFYSKDGF